MTNNFSLQPQGVRLEVRGVDKRYGTRDVLKKTELVIEPGQFVAIVGRSGWVARVISEGVVRPGDSIELLPRNPG